MNIIKISFMLLSMAFIATSCDPDDPEPVNEEELITTLRYTLTPNNGGNPVELSFTDLDGDGGEDPVIIGGTLSANTTYTGEVLLLNESEKPAEDITEEVREEDEEHQFFFVSSGADLDIVYADSDDEGNPVGVETTITTGNASSGQLTIILRHEPDKTAQGVAEGNPDNAGGETDIEATFDITIL